MEVVPRVCTHPLGVALDSISQAPKGGWPPRLEHTRPCAHAATTYLRKLGREKIV